MHKALLILITIFLAACGSSPIQYQASSIDINKAKDIVEELTWSQHSNWKPDAFEITDKYIAWDYGTTSESRGMATSIGNSGVAIGGGSSRTRNIGDRSYYRSIQNVQLLSWTRKTRQWYVVSLIDKDGSAKHVLRTQSLDDAKLFTDGMSTIVNYYKNTVDEIKLDNK